MKEGCCSARVVMQLTPGGCCCGEGPQDLVAVASGPNHREAGNAAGSLGMVASAGFMQST